MNIASDEISVLITANADQLRKELGDVNKRLGVLDSSIGGISKVVNKQFTGSIFKATVASQVLIKAVSSIGRGIFNMGKQVVNLGTQYTRLKVSTDTVTRNMGMTRQEVDDLRASLESANTYGSKAEEVIKSLAMSGLVKMARELKAVDARTGETVEGVQSLVLGMKDLGAAAGMDSAQAIQAVSRFIMRGNLAMADGLIELGNLGREYSDFAKTIGKTRNELTAQEEAQARLLISVRESKKAFGAYANTMQTAGKAMDSTKNAITAIFERLGNYLEPVFASVARAVYVFVDSIRQSLIGNAQSFKNWANKVAAYVIAVVRILGGLLTRIPVIGKNFVALKNFALKPVVSTLDNLEKSTGGVSSAMKGATKSTKDLKKELAGLQGFDEMNVLKPPEEDGGGASTGGVGGGSSALDNLKELFKVEDLNASVDEINGMADEIEKTLRDKLGNLSKKLEPLMKILEPIGKWFIDNLGPILLVAGAIGLLNTAVGIAVKTFSSMKAIGSVITFITGLFAKGGAWDSIRLALMYGFEAIKGVLIAIASALGISVGWVIAIIAALVVTTVLLVKNWDWVKEKAVMIWTWLSDNVFKPVGEFFTKIFEGMVNTVKDWFQKISDFFNKIKTEIFDPVAKEIDKIVNGLIIPIIHNFILVMGLLWEGFKDMLAKVWGWIKDKIIQPVLDWLKTYVVANIKLVIDELVRVFNQLKDAVKVAWDWIRYKVIQPFLNWFEKNITPVIEKVAEGIKRAFSTVGDFLSGMWEGIKNTFKGGINWIIDKVNAFIGSANNLIRKYNDSVGAMPGAMKITYRFGTIPKLAQGGIIENPTLAMLGEAGREAVMPLDRNTEWIDELASKIGGKEGSINLVVKIGEEKVFEKAIDYINDKSLRTGMAILNI